MSCKLAGIILMVTGIIMLVMSWVLPTSNEITGTRLLQILPEISLMTFTGGIGLFIYGSIKGN